MNSKIRLIGICGQGPKSGKSEAANIIASLIPINDDPAWSDISRWRIRSFGEGPKFIVQQITGMYYVKLNSQLTKDLIAKGWETNQSIPRTYRDLIIDVAEGLRERIREDVWVKTLFSDWNEECEWIIDDVRFLPEVRKIAAEGGILIKVLRNHAEKGEIEIPDQYIKYEVNNNGSLQELEDQLKEILKLEGLL